MTKFRTNDLVRFKGTEKPVFTVVTVNDYSDVTYELATHASGRADGHLDWIEGDQLEYAEPPREFEVGDVYRLTDHGGYKHTDEGGNPVHIHILDVQHTGRVEYLRTDTPGEVIYTDHLQLGVSPLVFSLDGRHNQ